MTTFFTSDLHLGHARICELAGRPFASVREHDDELVRRWNEVVHEGDEVVVLGDLAMGTLEESLARVAELHGRKYLIPGNHDRVSSLYDGTDRQKTKWSRMYEEAGVIVAREYHTMSLRVADRVRRITLCHFPYEGDSQDVDRHSGARPLDMGLWLLHGHTHSKERVRGKQLHVGVDAWDFTPVPIFTVCELIARAEAA